MIRGGTNDIILACSRHGLCDYSSEHIWFGRPTYNVKNTKISKSDAVGGKKFNCALIDPQNLSLDYNRGHSMRVLKPKRKLGIKPRGRTHDKAGRLERMLSDIDFDLHGKRISEHRARIHGSVNLLAVGHHRVSGQGVIMLPAGKLTNATDFAVNGTQPRPVASAPDHAFVVGRANLAASLNQRAIGVEKELSVVNGSPSRSLTPIDTTIPASLQD